MTKVKRTISYMCGILASLVKIGNKSLNKIIGQTVGAALGSTVYWRFLTIGIVHGAIWGLLLSTGIFISENIVNSNRRPS